MTEVKHSLCDAEYADIRVGIFESRLSKNNSGRVHKKTKKLLTRTWEYLTEVKYSLCDTECAEENPTPKPLPKGGEITEARLALRGDVPTP